MRHVFAIILCLSACQQGEQNNELVGGDDAIRGVPAELKQQLALGVVLRTTIEANLRDAPNPSGRIMRVMAKGSELTIVRSASDVDGFLSVSHAGTQGWVNGMLVSFVATEKPAAVYTIADPTQYIDETPDPIAPSGAATVTGPPPPPEDMALPTPVAPTPTPLDDAIARAQTGVGYSYWWGGARWDPSGATTGNKGACTGTCPDCGHSGTYGADCSGFVAKVWQIPAWNTDLTKNAHPYSTYVFVNAKYEWKDVARDAIKKADALVYNQNGSGHIMLYESGDAWGQLWSYESRGCSVGIVHNLRTVPDKYKAIRRDGW